MKIAGSMFAVAAVFLLFAVDAGSPSLARGGGGGHMGGLGGGYGGHDGGFGGHEGGFGRQDGGFGGAFPLLDRGRSGDSYGGEFRRGYDGYAPRLDLPLDGQDYEDDAGDYGASFCGQTDRSYNGEVHTYADAEGRLHPCP